MVALPDKRTAFIDWYLAVVEAAELSDKRYGIKGMNVWTTYGFRARRNLDRVLVREAEASGAEGVEFPALIPATEFAKEKEHIQGFDAQVYWVTKGGLSELDVPLVLRPTSETAMYPIFALWVRSHKDLPLNVYQIVNTFRYETKTTRPFVRVREIHFFEEHTCQVDEARATERVAANLAAFRRMAASFALPYLAVRRPEWDKFAGAHYSVALDIPIGEARTLQIGSVHHYRENFSVPYGIRYEAADGTQRPVHQTTFGLSERLLGAILAVHGDEKGAVFPSEIAPYEVVIVPIPAGEAGPEIERIAEEIAERLRRAGRRAHVDRGDERPGAKYYRWELKGVPLRLEVGKREAEGRRATAVDRLGRKSFVSLDALEAEVGERLASFDAALAEAAGIRFRDAFSVAAHLSDLAQSDRVRLVGWCGREECGHAIEKAIDGALLGTPEEGLPFAIDPPATCLVCGTADGVRWALAGRPL
ncbi:MAG TPA: proline--tRNA ligase [Thermoplasmata archaeon]|nr:proline--tRNA ligase [Thermoplasmata archaeon]